MLVSVCAFLWRQDRARNSAEAPPIILVLYYYIDLPVISSRTLTIYSFLGAELFPADSKGKLRFCCWQLNSSFFCLKKEALTKMVRSKVLGVLACTTIPSALFGKEISMIDWSQQFLLASINRADLTEFGLSDEQIAAFTDEQMKQIAEKMQTGYYLKKPF